MLFSLDGVRVPNCLPTIASLLFTPQPLCTGIGEEVGPDAILARSVASI